jgi:drug/metabolite transporter (DMT)-like permease
MEIAFGLASALANAVSAVVSRGLAERFPARQLIGPLFGLNALLMWPLAPFVEWTWSPLIVVLHLASIGLLIATSLSIWDLFAHGAASANVVAQSISPLPAALAVALLLPGTLQPVQAVAAVVVVVAVVSAVAGSYSSLGRTRSVLTVLVAATGTGLVTVMGRLLADQGVGVVETYVVRTSGASLLFLLFIPPRAIPFRHELPRLALRSVLVSLHFVLILLGVQGGNPALVQTAVATAPIWVIGWESFRLRRRPSRRVLAAATVALAGVAATLLA